MYTGLKSLMSKKEKKIVYTFEWEDFLFCVLN